MPKKAQQQKVKIYDLSTNIFAETARGIRLGLVNLWRNRLLSLATIMVIAIMICIFNSILAVNYITRQALTNLNQKVDIVFYLKEGTDSYTANQLASQIKDLPGVRNVDYVTKEDALNIISKTYPETADFLLKFNLKNPLPASLSVTTDSAEYQQQVYDFIAKNPLRQYVENSDQNNRTDNQSIIASTAKNLISINNFVKQLIFWVVFIFIIGSTLITINAIQLTIFMRRNEIFIMKLVGATPSFIRLPFLTEGVCYAVLAVILSFGLLFLAGKAVDLQNLEILKDLGTLPLNNIFLAELAVCSLLAIISSLAVVEKYIRGNLSYN